MSIGREVIVIGCGSSNTGLLLDIVRKANPGCIVLLANEAEARGLVPDRVFLPFELRPPMPQDDLILFERQKRKKDWEPAQFPRKKKKR